MRGRRTQVSAANAQKRRLASDQKMQNNVTRRGLVPDNAAQVCLPGGALSHHPSVEPSLTDYVTVMCPQRRAGKLSAGPILLGFFFVVILGSSALLSFPVFPESLFAG